VKFAQASLCVPVEGVEYQAAVYETVRHEAVTEMVYGRYSWTPGRHDNAEDTPNLTGSTPTTDPSHWQLNQKPDPKDDPVGSAFKTGHGQNASWFFWVGSQRVITEAYDEQVLVSPEVAAVEAVYCEWYTWDTGSWTPTATNANDVTWPQSLVGAGQIAPTACETTYQQDLYRGTRAQIDAVVGDGILTGPNPPEDSALVQKWDMVSTELCPPVLIEVTPEVITTDPCGPDNATIVGVENEGVMWSTTDDPYTIVATPAPGYTFGEAQTEFTVVESGEACIVEVEAVAPFAVGPPLCGANNDEVTITETDGVTYSDTGWIEGERTITATAKAGYALTGTAEWTFIDAATECPIEITETAVTTEAPTVVAVCMPNNDTVTIPEVVGVNYTDTGWVDGQRTITATPDEGFTLLGDTTWTFVDVPSAACPAVGPVYSFLAANELASTGTSSDTRGMLALAISLLATGTVLVSRKVLS